MSKEQEKDMLDDLIDDNEVKEKSNDNQMLNLSKAGSHKKNVGSSGKRGKKSAVMDEEEQQKKILSILLKFVLPMIVISTITLVVGFIFGKIFYEEPDTTPQNTTLESRTTVEELTENYQGDQVDALRKQIEQLGSQTEVSSAFSEGKELLAFKRMNEDTKNVIEPFIDKLLTTPRYADDRELELKRKDLMEYTTEKGANALYPLLTGMSPAKDLEFDGERSASTFSTLLGVDKNDNQVYFTMTPYRANDEVVNATYIIKVDKEESLITYATYTGILGSDSTGNITYEALKDALDGNSVTTEAKENKKDNEQDSDKDNNKDENKDDNKDENKDENKDDNKDENKE